MNARRSNNAVKGIMANGLWVDDPRRVKEEIYTFFENRFTEPEQHRPILDGTRFCGID